MTPTTERRQEVRWDEHRGLMASLNGYRARLHDLSSWGARLESGHAPGAGAVVRLDLPWGPPVRAQVLGSGCGVIRVRFEEAVDPLI